MSRALEKAHRNGAQLRKMGAPRKTFLPGGDSESASELTSIYVCTINSQEQKEFDLEAASQSREHPSVWAWCDTRGATRRR